MHAHQMSAAATTTLFPASHAMASTFLASLRSVGTAVTMATVGLYLHQTGAIGAEGKRTLAILSQQITFPLFLFTKIIYCNQNWSNEPCPDVTQTLADVWMLLWWPIYVVAVGLMIGYVVAKVTRTPSHQVRSVLAACGFGNSTGLPITLLNVIHSNFPVDSDLGRMDPTLFLSVFLLLYPVLQWGLGGWLLTPDAMAETSDETIAMLADNDDPNQKSFRSSSKRQSSSRSLLNNVLNNTERKSFYKQHRHGLASADEGLYMTEMYVDTTNAINKSICAHLTTL
jgi:predicted permease